MLNGLAGFQDLVMLIIWVAFLALGVWAFVDCARRRAELFPAIQRQSKVLWLVLTGLGSLATFAFGPLSLFGIASIVISLVYLFDVRPRMVEITERRW